jgi:hypothetical protein
VAKPAVGINVQEGDMTVKKGHRGRSSSPSLELIP